MDTKYAPDSILRLIGWLNVWPTTERTINCSSSLNQIVRFTHEDETFVDIIVDRGQWFIEIGFSPWDQGFHVVIWEACLSGSEAPMEVIPLEAQIDRVIAVARSASGASVTLECMEEQRRLRTEKRSKLSIDDLLSDEEKGRQGRTAR